VRVPCDDQDRVVPEALDRALRAVSGPTVIAVECGNVNTGAFDDFDAVADLADRHRAKGHPTWVHVDGAVMLLAAAAPQHVPARARSRPNGLVVHGRPQAAQRRVRLRGGHLPQPRSAPGGDERASQLPRAGHRRPRPHGLESRVLPPRPRRGRLRHAAFPRAVGRRRAFDRTVAHAQRFAQVLEASGRAQIVNDVVSNQVLVRWLAPDGDHGRQADAVMAAIRAEGLAFFSGTTYRGERLMRISVSDWATDTDDVDRVAEALLRHAGQSIS
jgi:glutamate/tyrosine decarboxylase-like PLP-dependent enzyme